MKKYRVVVRNAAKDDMREARNWYNKQLAGLGKKLNADMAVTLMKVARNPTSFAIRYRSIRLVNFQIFPYAAHFFIEENSSTVFVVAIIHTGMHPDVARSRM